MCTAPSRYGHKTWWADTAVEEFMVLLPDAPTARGGYLLAQQLCETVQAVHLGTKANPFP